MSRGLTHLLEPWYSKPKQAMDVYIKERNEEDRIALEEAEKREKKEAAAEEKARI